MSGGNEAVSGMSADAGMVADPGWKYMHATYCSVYSDGSTTWFYEMVGLSCQFSVLSALDLDS
jgi:hypothetical protein